MTEPAITLAAKRAVSTGAVELIEDMLARAKAGEVTEVVLMARCSNGDWMRVSSEHLNRIEVIGEMFCAMTGLADSMRSKTR